MRISAWSAALTALVFLRGTCTEEDAPATFVAGDVGNDINNSILYGPGRPGEDGRRRRQLYSIRQQAQPIRVLLWAPESKAEGYDCREPGDQVQIGSPSPSSEFPTSSACEEITHKRGGIQVHNDCLHTCSLPDVVVEQQRQELQEALANVSAWFASALSVLPVQGSLRVPNLPDCAEHNHVALPDAFVEGGVPGADLLVTVAVRPLAKGMVSNSTICSRDAWGRPVAAHLSLSPTLLSHSGRFEDTANKRRLLQRVLLHEVTHVLGFDKTSLLLFRDERLQLRSSVLARVQHQGQLLEGVQTPGVVAAAREHFEAPRTQGFPLQENSTSEGSKDIHWHPEAAVNEIMSTSVSTASVYSSLTLALLQDSGWYLANLSSAEDWSWGRGQGDRILQLPCSELPEGAYNCAERGAHRCSYDRLSTGVCERAPSWVPKGSSSLSLGYGSAPKCNVVLPSEAGVCGDANGELGPESSRCFELSEPRGAEDEEESSAVASKPVCFPHRCLEDGLLSVWASSEWVECPREGGSVPLSATRTGANEEEVPQSSAVLHCPAAYELCKQPPPCPNACSGSGECVNSRCNCWAGWSTEDCSERECPESCEAPGAARCSETGECVCNDGWAGADCSSRVSEPCATDCSEFGPGAVCIDGHCERRCSSESALSRCIDASAAAPYLQLCGRYLDGAMICGPENLEDITGIEATKLGEHLQSLIPLHPASFSASTAVCHESALHLACALSFQVCDETRSEIVVPTCLSTCYSFHNDCNLYSGDTDVWCSPGKTFRDDTDERGCVARRQVSWMHHSLQTLSIYALFLLGSCLLLYSAYRLMRTWYVYSSYGGTTWGWFRWMFCGCLPTWQGRSRPERL